MTDAPIESDVAGETREERLARLNFFMDSVRAGLHASGADIMEMMMANATPDIGTCMLGGACQFLAELYEETATKSGANKAEMKAHMLKSVGVYFDNYCEMSVKDSLLLAAGQPQGKGERVQ